MSKIIALLANKECGKTTLANVLTEKYNFKKLSFAKPVKLFSKHIIECWLDELKTSSLSNKDFELFRKIMEQFYVKEDKSFFRGLYQGVGDGARQWIDENLWLDMLVHKIINNSDVDYVIDDCRYLNEMLVLKKLKAKLVYLEKLGSDGSHSSECVQANISKLKHSFNIDVDLVIPYNKGKDNAIRSIEHFIKNNDINI